MPEPDTYKNPYDFFEESILAKNDVELNALYDQYQKERAKLGEMAEYELAVNRSLSGVKIIEQRDLLASLHKKICERLGSAD